MIDLKHQPSFLKKQNDRREVIFIQIAMIFVLVAAILYLWLVVLPKEKLVFLKDPTSWSNQLEATSIIIREQR